MLFPRYFGRFYGLMPFFKVESDRYKDAERRWDVTIYQAADSAPEAEALVLAAESPLSIEWDAVAPEDVVEGSTATLRLVSPTDRAYAGLYTIDPLGVVLEVSAGGQTVWRGALEPELYEEPYATKDGYIVELNFADIAGMDRVDFAHIGKVTLHDILTSAIAATPLSGYLLRSATRIVEPGGNVTTPLNLSRLCISSDNFVDDDGKAKTMREAVEMILRPFGLRLRQHAGALHVYDWHSVATGRALKIDWVSTDSKMSVAPVAHAVTLTYSPYADASLVDGTIDTDSLPLSEGGRELSVNLSYDNDDPDNAFGFRIVSPRDIPEDAIPHGMATDGPLFRIVSGHSGSDTAGIIGVCSPRAPFSLSGVGLSMITNEQFASRNIPGLPEVMTLTGPWLSSLTSFDYFVKLTLSALIDPRYNPYEEKGKYNEGGNYDDFQDWCNFAYIPCALELVGDGDRVLAHYDNHAVVASDAAGDMGQWVTGPATVGDMWLAYYDANNRKSASGLCGWKKNRQAIGYWRGDLPAIYEKRGDGEFVPFPRLDGALSGYLRLRIYSGLYWFDYGRKGEADPRNPLFPDSGVHLGEIIRWALYGAAEMEIVRADGTDIDTGDVIYTATAIPGAASPVEVSLEVGSAVKAPTARAVLSLIDAASQLRPVGDEAFERSRRGKLEALLLDTLVSQYDEPHLVLSGTANLSPFLTDEIYAWQDASQPADRLFVVTSATIDAQAGTADYAFREISPDSYTPTNK